MLHDTESKTTANLKESVYCRVYSTDESVRIEFTNGDMEAGAWLTEDHARKLIELIQATFVEKNVGAA